MPVARRRAPPPPPGCRGQGPVPSTATASDFRTRRDADRQPRPARAVPILNPRPFRHARRPFPQSHEPEGFSGPVGRLQNRLFRGLCPLRTGSRPAAPEPDGHPARRRLRDDSRHHAGLGGLLGGQSGYRPPLGHAEPERQLPGTGARHAADLRGAAGRRRAVDLFLGRRGAATTPAWCWPVPPVPSRWCRGARLRAARQAPRSSCAAASTAATRACTSGGSARIASTSARRSRRASCSRSITASITATASGPMS